MSAVIGLLMIASAAWSVSALARSTDASGAEPGATTAFTSASTTSGSVGPVSVGLGDLRTADPCSLLAVEPLLGFGKVIPVPGYGGFDRCDTHIEQSAGRIDTKLQFQRPGGLPAGTQDTVSGITVVREPPSGNSCARTLLLPDLQQIRVESVVEHGRSTQQCEVADTVTRHALDVLARGEVPRRAAADPASLIHQDACALPDTGPLVEALGVTAPGSISWFGAWGCIWSGPGDAEVIVRFERHKELSGPPGERRRIAGRDAVVQSDNQRECDVELLHRPYAAPTGASFFELLMIDVQLPKPSPNPCASAIAITAAAAAKLPK